MHACTQARNMRCRDVSRYRTEVVLGKRYKRCRGFQGELHTWIQQYKVVCVWQAGPNVGSEWNRSVGDKGTMSNEWEMSV